MYSRRVHVDDSSNVECIDYDPEINSMRVTFLKGGGTYIYTRVPAQLFGELVSAPSVGKFLQKHVVNKFETTRIGK